MKKEGFEVTAGGGGDFGLSSEAQIILYHSQGDLRDWPTRQNF